jgi:hypothetical protein
MPKTKKLWCYLNITNPIVAWEVGIGRISSIDSSINLNEETRKSFLSLWQYSRLKIASEQNNWQPFILEMRMEYIRHLDFHHKVSRMRGCYFFESRELALSIVENFNWNGIGFKEDFLSEIEFIYDDESNISIYDSAWITSTMSDTEIKCYLNEDTKYENPASEFLCYGHGIVLNQELIDAAEKRVREEFPNALAFFDSAKIIYHKFFLKKYQNKEIFNWDAYHVAQVSPFIRKINDEFGEVIILMSDIALKKYGIIEDTRKLITPDLRPHMFKISSEEFNRANQIALKI